MTKIAFIGEEVLALSANIFTFSLLENTELELIENQRYCITFDTQRAASHLWLAESRITIPNEIRYDP